MASALEPRVMSIARRLLTVVDRQMTVDELAVLLLEHHVSTAVVVGPVGGILGFVSMNDLPRENVLDSQGPDGTLVRDVMTPLVVTIPEESDIPYAAAVMASRNVHQLFVRAAAGPIIAVLHARDVLAWFARSRGLAIPGDDDGEWRRNRLFSL